MSRVPYLTVERRGIAEARAASRTDFRIEAGDVYALHRHCIRRAAYQSCKFNDFFVPAVQLAKRCFAIELIRQKRLLAGPVALFAKRIDRWFDCILHRRVEAGGLRTVCCVHVQKSEPADLGEAKGKPRRDDGPSFQSTNQKGVGE